MAARALPERPWRVLSVIGTRPEAIKMAPLVRALAALPSIEQRLILTGQHAGLSDSFAGTALEELGLNVRNKSIAALRQTLTGAIAHRLKQAAPDLVVVQGDTTSALAGALAARACNIPVAHVEAGLRSHRRQPWPEESNRVAIDSVSELLFAPTEAAAANLAAEPVTGAVHVTGNTGIDALLLASNPSRSVVPQGPRKPILVTCHRRENRNLTLARICTAIKTLVAELPVEILFPLHLNRHLRAGIQQVLGGLDHIRLTDPLPHAEMVRRMEESWLILTDSGGLQEEGPALGRPVLVMRDVTERIEAPANVALVGTDPAAIVAAVNRLLMDEVHYARMSRPALPFGDGHAAPRIATLIEDWLASRTP